MLNAWGTIGPVCDYICLRWSLVKRRPSETVIVWHEKANECGIDGSILSGAVHQIMACDRHESCNHSRAPQNAAQSHHRIDRGNANQLMIIFPYLFFALCFRP